MTKPAPAGYQAALEGVALLDLSNRGKVEVTGPDRLTFLHAMITNDVTELPDWQGRYGAFLTSTGKMVSDFYYYRFPDRVFLDLAPCLLSTTIETLEKFIIMDEVFLTDASERFGHLSLQGPRSGDLLQEVLPVDLPTAQYQLQAEQWQKAEVWIVAKSHLAASGFEILCPAEATTALRNQIETRGRGLGLGLELLSEAAAEVLRVEAGHPRYGVDMTEKNYPMEARLDTAISFTKGCYIGQEVVSKATYVGGVSRLLTPLLLSSSAVPEPGAAVLTPEGNPIGKVTSAVLSPRLGCAIALAYLKKNYARPEVDCRVELPEQGSAQARVVDQFLPQPAANPTA